MTAAAPVRFTYRADKLAEARELIARRMAKETGEAFERALFEVGFIKMDKAHQVDTMLALYAIRENKRVEKLEELCRALYDRVKIYNNVHDRLRFDSQMEALGLLEEDR